VASVFRQITENWKLKTLAFALAVLLWVVVSSEQVTSNWIGVPLEVQVTDPNFRIASTDLPNEVEVRFTGPARDLLDLALRRPPLRLSIAEVQGQVETRALDPRMVQLPGQVAVSAQEVRPGTVRLEFVRMDTRTLPVRVQLSNQIGAEWAIMDSIATDPPVVRVRGPSERIAALDEITTDTVELMPGDSIFNRVVPLDTSIVRGLELSAREVRVTARLDRVVQRTIEGVRVDVGAGVVIRPQEVDVVLRGPRSAVENVAPGFFRVVVSIGEIPSRIPADGVPVPLRIDGLRPDVLASVDPASVRLFPAGPQLDTLMTPAQNPIRDSLRPAVSNDP
jgi:YbbR domain-containing protein